MPSIYITTNELNKSQGIMPWRYIGSDQFDNPDYLGSSKQLKSDIETIGREHFTKEIIDKFDFISNRDLRLLESEYLSINNVKLDETFYNKTDRYAPGGGVKGMKHSSKFPRSEKWRESRAGWTPSDETRSKWKEQRLGKEHSIETRTLMSQQRSGEKNHNALEWEITDPSGNTYKCKGLRTFCNEMNWNFGEVYGSKNGWKSVKNGHGKGGRSKNEQRI
jgi:hypothetical protein